MRHLLRALWKVLTFLLRLVLFGITGEWVQIRSVGSGGATGPRTPSAPNDRARLQAAAHALQQAQSTRVPTEAHVRFARLFAEPLTEHLRAQGLSLRKRPLLILSEAPEPPELLPGIREHTRFLPVVIPAAELSEPSGYVKAARAHLLGLSLDVPGWLPRLRRELGWGTGDLLHIRLGAWLPELATDVLMALQLGPSYLEWLLAQTARGPADSPRTLWRVKEAPLVLRVHAALGALELLGLYNEIERLEKEVDARFGEAPNLVLMEGIAAPVPWEAWEDELQGLLASFEDEPPLGLTGGTVLDLTGVPYLHGEHARVQELARAWQAGDVSQGANGSARNLLAAALWAAHRGTPAGRLAGLLERSVGVVSRARPERAAAPRSGSRRQPSSLRAALRDPAALRGAVALGAAMSRPPAGRRGSRR